MERKVIDAAELILEAKKIQLRLYAESHDEIMSFDDLVKLADRLSSARLLTEEDFGGRQEAVPCWKESKSPTRRCGWDVIVFGRWWLDTDAGTARYWTQEPTEEQRRKTEWPE